MVIQAEKSVERWPYIVAKKERLHAIDSTLPFLHPNSSISEYHCILGNSTTNSEDFTPQCLGNGGTKGDDQTFEHDDTEITCSLHASDSKKAGRT